MLLALQQNTESEQNLKKMTPNKINRTLLRFIVINHQRDGNLRAARTANKQKKIKFYKRIEPYAHKHSQSVTHTHIKDNI